MPRLCTCPQGHRWEHPGDDDPTCPTCGAAATAVADAPAPADGPKPPPLPFDPRSLALEPAPERLTVQPATVAPAAARPPQADRTQRPAAPARQQHYQPPGRGSAGPVLLAVAITSVLFLAVGGVVFVLLSTHATERERQQQAIQAELEEQTRRARAAADEVRAAEQRARQLAQRERDEAEKHMREEQMLRQRDAENARVTEGQLRLQLQRAKEAAEKALAKPNTDDALKQAEARHAKELAAVKLKADGELYSTRVALADWDARLGNAERAAGYLKQCAPALRHWEWHYLDRTCNPEVATFAQHKDAVLAMALSPDGRRAVSTGRDLTLRLWDTASGKELRKWAAVSGPVRAAAFLPDGKTLVTASDDACFWDAESGKLLRTFDPHKAPLTALAVSPDGKLVVTAGNDGAARVWEADGGREVAAMKHPGKVLAVAFAPDGRMVASAGGEVVLWEAATGKEAVRGDASDGVVSLMFARGGALLIGLTANAKVRFWERDGAELRVAKIVFKGPPVVRALAVDGAGKTLYGAANDGATAWDLVGGAPARFYRGTKSPAQLLAVSRDGTRLAAASSDHLIRVWEAGRASDKHGVSGHEGGTNCVAFAPDGSALATCGADRTIRFWDPPTGKEIRKLEGHAGPVARVAFSSDGRRLVSVGGMAGKAPVEVKVWDVGAGKELCSLSAAASEHVSAVLSPDGKRVALASPGTAGGLRVFDADTGAEEKQGGGKGLSAGAEAECVAATPDGKRVALGLRNGGVAILDFTDPSWRTAPKRAQLPPRQGSVIGLSWSGDGKMLAVVTPNRITAWDVAGQKVMATLVGGRIDSRGTAWTPDGKRLATLSGGNSAMIWEMGPARNLANPRGPATFQAACVAFSPDSRWLAAGFSDGRAVLWDGSPRAGAKP